MSNPDVVVGAKIRTGKKTGTVMFVGEVDFNRGKWVGIEWDDPVGKHDGIVKGKRYFKCKPKHGGMTKISKVEVLEKKKRAKRDVGERKKESTKPPARFKTGREYKSVGTQTEEEDQPSVEVEGAQKVARENLELLHEMQEMADSRKERLTQEVKELEKRIRELEAENEEFRNAKDNAEQALHLERMEKENAQQELEFVQMDLEELQAKHEILELDLELMKENEETLKDDILESLTGDTQDVAIAIDERDKMEEALTQLKEAFETEVRKRDFKLVHLESQANLVPELQSEIRDLNNQMSEIKQVIVEKNSEISELTSDLDLLTENVDMVENLVEKNMVLEQRKLALEDELELLQESLEVQEELALENEEYQNELFQQLEDAQNELMEKEDEVQDLQRELFNTRNRMGRLEDSRTRLGRVQEEAFDASHDQLNHISDLKRELMMVSAALDECRQDIITSEVLKVQDSMTHMAHSMLEAHIPNSVEFDDMMLNFMKLLERCAGKAKGLNSITNRLFLDTANKTYTDEEYIAARSIAEHSLIIAGCLQVIITGVLTIAKDKFDNLLVSSRQLGNLEDTLDFVLAQISEKNLETYSPEDMQEAVKSCQDFVSSHFASQDPLKLKKEGKATKVHVTYNVGGILLKLLDMKHTYDRVSRKIGDLAVESPQDKQYFTEKQQAMNAEILARGVDEMGTEPTKVMKYDIDSTVLIKLDRLLVQILDRTKGIISECAVSFPEYGSTTKTTKQLYQSRECLVGFNMLSPCVERAVKCVTTMKGFLEKIAGIRQDGMFNDRLLEVNSVLHSHSRVHPEGMVSGLEELYNLVGTILQGTRSVAAVRDDADVRVRKVEAANRLPIWTVKANDIRNEIEAASKVREELEEAQSAIKDKNQELFKTQQTERQATTAMRVLEKEIAKLKARTTKLAEVEKSHKELMDKKERYKAEYAKQHEKAKKTAQQMLEIKKQLKEKTEDNTKLTSLLKSKPTRGGSDADLGGFSRKVGAFEKRRGSIDMKGESTFPSTIASKEASSYIRVLESTINQLRTEVNTMNFKSKSSALKRQLKPLNFYQKPVRKPDEKGKPDMATQFEKQLTKITKDLNHIWASPTIVDISSKNKFFTSSQSVLNRQTELQRIQKRGAKLKALISEQKAELTGLETPSRFTSKQLVGKIEIPYGASQFSSNVLVSPQDLHRIHDVFVH